MVATEKGRYSFVSLYILKGGEGSVSVLGFAKVFLKMWFGWKRW